jgi:hypothetical protein
MKDTRPAPVKVPPAPIPYFRIMMVAIILLTIATLAVRKRYPKVINTAWIVVLVIVAGKGIYNTNKYGNIIGWH